MKRSSGMERSQSSTWDTSDENRNKLVKAASTSKLLAKVVKNTERYRRTRSTHKACARYRRCFVDCQPSCVYIDKLFSFRHRDPVMSQGKHHTSSSSSSCVEMDRKPRRRFKAFLSSRPCCCCLCCLLLVFLSDRVFVSNQPKSRLERKTAKLVSRNDLSEQANGLMC